MRRPVALVALCVVLCVSAAGSGARSTPKIPWREVVLPRVEIPAAANALTRWRPLFPRLFPEDIQLRERVRELSSPLENFPTSPDAETLEKWLTQFGPRLEAFALATGETVQLPTMLGPETPFPDHQPLRQLALVRTATMKLAWRDGRPADALTLALDNLALSRALMRAQEGFIPVLNASGLWQIALDGVYWLARQRDLTAAQALQLQLALHADERLAADALIRAFRGEFSFFTRTTIDRLPRTRDVELFLSSIGSLGLAPPTAPAEGELRLKIPARDPFDTEATLQAAADDVQGWVNAFTATTRHPRDLYAAHTRPMLQRYAREIPALFTYASQDAPPTAEQIAAADTEIASVENPVGKLFLIITTSYWDPLSVSIFRREAQRSAMIGLLAWQRHGRPASWRDLAVAGLVADAPQDPFSATTLRCDVATARIWSVGLNGTDEGGKGDGANIGRPEDFVWRHQLSK